MAEMFEIDLNAKKKLPLREVRSAVIPAKGGWGHPLKAGQFIRVTDPCGKQAGDFWAFNASNLDEHLSAMHTRVWVNKLCPGPGEVISHQSSPADPAGHRRHVWGARSPDRRVRRAPLSAVRRARRTSKL